MPSTEAARFHRSRASQSRNASGVSLRKRLHANDLIAEPGTASLDLGTLYSYTTSTFTLPSALRFTPSGRSLFWGRTEYSAAFDAIASAPNADGRFTQFSDRVILAATSVVFDTEHFDVVIAPQVTAFLRNESGARIGATMIGRYDGGNNNIGVTASWTAATNPTDTNPAGIWDFGAGYGRRLRSSGILRRLTPHANSVLEKSTGFERTISLFGGIEYQITDRMAFDVSGQRFGLIGGIPDRQILVGLTMNFGRVH